jgi:hypothetical protein
MAVIEDYLAKQKHALHIALTGVGDNTEAMSVLGTLGIKGIGQLKHYALNYGQETLMEIAYIDTGRYTQTSKTLWANGTAMIVQTQARMYMVSKHYQPGMAVSMKEVRIVAPIKKGCALAIHTSEGRYEVVQEGILFCMSHLAGFGKVTLKKGDIMHADDREHCYNECIQIGHKGYMMEEKHMPTQPTVHPADMRQFKKDKLIGDQTAADKDKMMEGGHQLIHDKMAQDIRDSEDIIQEIRDSQAKDIDVGLHVGVAGVVVSVLTVFALLLICARCGWKRCKGSCGEARAGD